MERKKLVTAKLRFLTLLFLIVGTGFLDFQLDHGFDMQTTHQWFELTILLVTIAATVLLWQLHTKALNSELSATKKNLSDMTAKAKTWQQNHLVLVQGFGEVIDSQFDTWGLSHSERDIGVMLLKGCSVKEIAESRGVKEKTVHQQCQAIYKKAGISGRNQLFAFFLEDLLLPSQAESSAS